MKKILVTDFSEFPGPRYINLGPDSGELFRKTILLPEIEANNGEIIVVLDGAFGYGSSFLDEAFGGLIRDGVPKETVLSICNNLISEDDPSLKLEITQWVKDAIAHKES
ncbi:STAS-like domain-containing protein [Pseudomonas sp.]|uniref:STAS-like domain-containing protein n=1 Tax=Pseudomonas sp. TaxID=306 RepID=UPI002625CB3D|nr:STAS-like domain-containing protein [Pseudomonas sp.]